MSIACCDRFIPRRAGINLEQSYSILSGEVEGNDNKIQQRLKAYQKLSQFGDIVSLRACKSYENYRNALKKCLLPDPTQTRVLSFSIRHDVRNEESIPSDIWPVRPRRKPVLTKPSVILDLPNYHDFISPLDWGATGFIATIFDGEIHFWHPDGKHMEPTQTSYSVKDCLKWNHQGILLAVILHPSKLAIWDASFERITATVDCRPTVTAMEWTISNKLITGLSNGELICWSAKLTRQCTTSVEGRILSLKLSCKATYLGVKTTHMITVIQLWPVSGKRFDIRYDRGTMKMSSIGWHPWKDCLLAVGASYHVIIWNLHTESSIGHFTHPLKYCVVNLTFNPLSAELLINYVSSDPFRRSYYLTVLRNFEMIVDEVRGDGGSPSYLLWDSTGTKVAVADSHENLSIWEFFGSSANQMKKLSKMKKRKIPAVSESLLKMNTVR